MDFLDYKLTRRGIFAGLCGAAMVGGGSRADARQVGRPDPVDLGHGLEIRDYRLFPTKDVMRFIVEIHNTTDTAVDTPVVGVVLPHLEVNENFGWASPIGTVIHPGHSEILIGVAPKGIERDCDWKGCEWSLCTPIRSTIAQSLSTRDVVFTHALTLIDQSQARVDYAIENRSNARAASLIIHGIVRDGDGRVCGSLLPTSLQFLGPNQHGEKRVNINNRVDFTANPFHLISDVVGISVECSLQMRNEEYNLSCPAITPWAD